MLVTFLAEEQRSGYGMFTAVLKLSLIHIYR